MPLKTWPKRAKWSLKSGILGAKSAKLDVRNNELATKLERLNGAKCRLANPKTKKKGAEKAEKRGVFYAFRPLFSLKRLAVEVQFCKN
ncbi:hypothetical protein [Prevotella conceptionensis]|uniref:hypothetical protein n=1 Tax=Prevotella conceptionensis TaxID=340486 RepID=UPI0005C90EA4|nr:hypothetical protein [Prevotella conceptionensis]